MAKVILQNEKETALIILTLGAIGVFLFAPWSWAALSGSVADGLATDANATGSYQQKIQLLTQARMEKVQQCRLEADGQTTPRKSVEALRKLAMAHLEAGQKAEAIAVCSRMLDIKVVKTRVASCVLDVANASYNCGDYVTAKAIYKLVVEKGQSENAVFAAREGLARITIASGDAGMGARAADDLWKDFSGHVKAPEAMLRVAQAVENSGNTVKAAELYGRVAKNWPTSASGLKAIALSAGGKVQVEVPVVKPATSAEGRAMALVEAVHAEVMGKLAEGRKDEAKVLAAKAAVGWKDYQQQFPAEHRAETLYMRGQCLVIAGQYADATACFEQCVEEFPLGRNAASAQFNVGECYRMMKESGAIDKVTGDNMMRKAYARVLRNYSGGPMCKGAAARLGMTSVFVKGGLR